MYETIGLIIALVVTIISLNTAFGRYIAGSKRYWLLLALFFLFNNLTNYYWVEYNLVMNDYPTLSNYYTYLGWNTSFVILAVLMRVLQTEAERKTISIWQFLPIPFGIFHFCIYYKMDGVVIAAWEEAAIALLAVFCIQSVVYYMRNNYKVIRKPYMAATGLVYACIQYICWTARLYSDRQLFMVIYIVFIMTSFLIFPLMIVAMRRQFGEQRPNASVGQSLLSPSFRGTLNITYLVFLLVTCIGGYFVGAWCRDSYMSAHGTVEFNVIAVMLFIFSVGLVLFTAMIMFMAGFGQKLMENDKIRRDKEIAEKANNAKSDFLANMSHEIRTPLNAVLGMNEMIINESMNARDKFPGDEEKVRAIFSEICSYAGNIRGAGGNLLNIINDILDFSKIEAGKMELVSGEYKLSSVLNDTGNMIAMKADAKGLDFKVNIDRNIPDGLYGDETRVRQILINVLNNAVKYTENGTVELDVSCTEPQKTDNGTEFNLVVTVKDTGIGIKPEDLKRLFGKFERMDLEHNSTTEGTGLGLAITQNLVDMMHGRINVESVYHEGTTFTITIPQRIVSEEPVGDFKAKYEQSIRDSHVKEEIFTAPEAKILIVDDTRVNILVAEGLLKKTLMQMDGAYSGREALKHTTEKKYDLILMDQRMPEMDGTETMHRIKDQLDGLNRDTKVICMTADAVTGAKERYLAGGFDDYLTKPVDSVEMKRMIMKYLPRAKVIKSVLGEFSSVPADGRE
ncbi:MAG: response regulator [Lachnospiraceae bacterium]|nr:response regulator [Lachnospiraceae bacterium]